MNKQADKSQDKKSKAAPNSVPDKKNTSESAFQFEDNRPEAIAQRKMQEMANNSPRAKKIAQLQAMTNTHSDSAIQKQGMEEEEEELLQGKFETVQRQEEEELQMKSETLQRKEENAPNNTGLPDNLKSGVENLSGVDISDVNVHYNSDKPAQLEAHAYAQGTDIHLAPGQEKHLPHEAWHVVQQKQGRVKPTIQLKDGVKINNDVGLEKEADMMGVKAVQLRQDEGVATFQLVDNRLEKVAQSKLTEGAQNSPQAVKPAGLHLVTSSHPVIQQPQEAGIKTPTQLSIAYAEVHDDIEAQSPHHSGAEPVQMVGVGSNIRDDESLADEGLAITDSTAAYLGTGLTGPSYANAMDSKKLPEPHKGDLGSGGGTSAGVAAVGGGLGAGVNLVTGAQALYGLATSKTKETKASYNEKNAELESGNQQLYAAVQILETEKDKAKTSDLENLEQVGGSINGVINGITTLLNSISSVANTATAAISAVTFGIGGALNALMGTINGIRDSLNAHKRRIGQKAVLQLTDFCNGLLGKYMGAISGVKEEMESSRETYFLAHSFLVKNDRTKENDILYGLHSDTVLNYTQSLPGRRGKIAGFESKMNVVMDMVGGLNVSGRKLGYKEKATTAGLNFTAAAGGAALLAATIGGVAAAATPIGWGLAGVAAVGLLIWQTGKHVKRKIRGSNVVRMRQERTLINEAVGSGTDKNSMWYRDRFPTKGKKGWFNKLTSSLFNKKKSGKISISERLRELDRYLAKYDTEDAADKAYAGILAALTSDQGDDTVDVGNGLQKTFREATKELLVTLKLDPAKILDSMNGDLEAQQQAKQLVLNKMNLIPREAPKEEGAEAVGQEEQ
jgi:hypothetical protein